MEGNVYAVKYYEILPKSKCFKNIHVIPAGNGNRKYYLALDVFNSSFNLDIILVTEY